MKATTFENVPQKDTDYEAAIDGLMGEINRMRQEMQQSQQRIEQYRADTRSTLNSTQAILDKMASL